MQKPHFLIFLISNFYSLKNSYMVYIHGTLISSDVGKTIPLSPGNGI